MKKIAKPLIITGIVLVAAVLLILLINALPDKQPEATPTPGSSSSVEETIYLINEDYYSLDRVKVHFRDTPELDLEIEAYTEDEQRQFRVIPSVEGWTYDRNTLSSTAWNAVSVSALAKVAESTTDLAYYGLDDPQYVFDISFTNGNAFHLVIGKLTAVEDSYYGMIDDDPAVYAVGKYSIQKLTTPELGYRELNFFDTTNYLDESNGTYDADGRITYVHLKSESRGLDIELRQRTSEELSGDLPAGTTNWHMSAPIESECNDMAVEDNFVDRIIPFRIKAVSTDVADDTMLEEFGFDDPIELWMENIDGNKVHYYIGQYSAGGDCYAMAEGCDSILIAEGFDPGILDTNYIDLMFKLLWIKNIREVKRVEFDLGDQRRLLNIIENYKDDEGNDVFYATLDGRSIDSTNARRLFTYALNLMIVGELKEDINVSAKKPDYSLALVMADGERHTLELYALNERQYAASVNGEEASFYVNVSDIKDLKTAFEYQDRGDEVPRPN